MLGFTAGMDEFDDERFARGSEALAAASRSAARVIRGDGDREELRCATDGRSAAIRVVARSETGRLQLRREVQLLAALEVGGITAAPTVLEIEDEGYVRENATPLRERRGRRCAEETTPATGERQAQARAREALDTLIDALHDHGWVLGAPVGEGLGLRADGSVTVLDLSGLRPEHRTEARLEDRLWVDSVLRDEGRTLRRRIDAHPSSASSPPAGSPPAILGARHWSTAPPAAAGHAENESPGDESQLDDDLVDEEAPDLRPLPAPRSPRHPAGPQQPGTTGALARSLRATGRLRRLGEELRAPGLRRIAVLSAVAVLIAGGALGSGVWWLAPEASPPVQTAPTEGTDSLPPHDAEVPQIAHPLSLTTELADARHIYVTGASGAPVAAPGSPAEAADEEVRRAYEHATVEDAAPQVLSARVVEGPTREGTARIAVQTSTPAHTVIEADGTTTSAPATGAVSVELELRWSTGRWWVVDVLQTR